MARWDVEPYWEILDRLQAIVAVKTGDVLAVHLVDEARLPVRVRRTYRGLDVIKSYVGQGQPGILIRLPGR